MKDCIDSILKEKSDIYEIIVVDDNSTDNSIAILNKYKKSNLLSLIALRRNKGAAHARNTGASKAKG
ncbi:MAG: glycosyltransferase, partial [bacterium]|nr:glycosyltransferase [bacterium]